MLTEKQFLDQLTQLVSIPSLSGDVAQNGLALDYVTTLLHQQAKVTRLQNQSAEILIASTHDTLTPQYGYLVHIDVVAAKPHLFTLQHQDDIVRGRGVSDMKFSIPLGIALLNECLKQSSDLRFSLVITTDEETGGFAGAAHLAEKIQWRPEVLIVPDGGDNFVFVNKGKGVCQLQLTATGSPAHASRPWQGKNALHPLVRIMSSLLDRYEQPSSKESWVTTLNIGQIHGGISTNQVCDQAILNLDFRYPETDTLERIRAEVEALAQPFADQVEVKLLAYGLPTHTDQNLPVVQAFLTSMAAETRHPLVVKESYGASDARHFAPYGIPVLMMKPIGGDIHCDSEWLSVHSALEYYQGLRRFLKLNEPSNCESD